MIRYIKKAIKHYETEIKKNEFDPIIQTLINQKMSGSICAYKDILRELKEQTQRDGKVVILESDFV